MPLEHIVLVALEIEAAALLVDTDAVGRNFPCALGQLGERARLPAIKMAVPVAFRPPDEAAVVERL